MTHETPPQSDAERAGYEYLKPGDDATDREIAIVQKINALIRELKAGPSDEARSWAETYNEHNDEFWFAPDRATSAMFGHHYGYAAGASAQAGRDKFQEAILREAIAFAQKVVLFSDPEIQASHEQGLQEIREGKALTIEELRAARAPKEPEA